MMKKIFLTLCYAAVFILIQNPLDSHNSGFAVLEPSTALANPFTQKKAVQPPRQPSNFTMLRKMSVTLVHWQQMLREKMSGLIREAGKEGESGTLLIILGTAFVYGLVHAAGPGHGKAVAMSYIAGTRAKLTQGLLFGNILAMTHAASGILLVLAVKLILHGSIRSTLEQVTRVTQLISFSLITLLGIFLIIKAITDIRSSQPEKEASSTPPQGMISAVIIGIIPCPGVVMVMLFCMSMEAFWLGILMGLSIGAGMAVTISCVVAFTVFGKKTVLLSTDSRETGHGKAEIIIRLLAGVTVTLLGISFLLSLSA